MKNAWNRKVLISTARPTATTTRIGSSCQKLSRGRPPDLVRSAGAATSSAAAALTSASALSGGTGSESPTVTGGAFLWYGWKRRDQGRLPRYPARTAAVPHMKGVLVNGCSGH